MNLRAVSFRTNCCHVDLEKLLGSKKTYRISFLRKKSKMSYF